MGDLRLATGKEAYQSRVFRLNSKVQDTYSDIWVACLFAAVGIELILCTTIPYNPVAEPVHPGGGGSDGAIEAVTACLATS